MNVIVYNVSSNFKVGQEKAQTGKSWMFLFHGIQSGKYGIWFTFHGLGTQIAMNVDIQNYTEWHKEFVIFLYFLN